jgi:gliding motility-associated-like protein
MTTAVCVGQDCFYSSPTVIQSEDSLSISIEVSGLVNDDLAAGQGICGIRLFFNHGQLDNIRMILTSPSGQTITLIGPGTINSGITSFINWNISFLPSSSPVVPDAGFSDRWDNDQPWASFTMYTGSYYPFNGDLEDFDTGSANGVWTLDIENLGGVDGNIEFFELIFCDPAGIDCESCFLDAGDMQQEFFTTCQQDIRLRDLDAFLSPDFIIDTDQTYSYVLSSADDIIAIEQEILQSDTLTPGVYTICGIAYQQMDSTDIQQQAQLSQLTQLIESDAICADITSPCFTLMISAVDNILSLDTTLCRGDTLDFFGIRVFDNLDTNILRTNQITCDSLITIRSTLIEPIADISPSDLVVSCDSQVFLDASGSSSNGSAINYNWSTIDGNYTLDIGPVAQVDTAGYYLLEVESDNCTDTIGLAISSIDTFGLDITVEAPVCVGDTFVINFDTDVDMLTINGSATLDIFDDGFTTIEEGTFFLETQIGQCIRLDTLELIDTTSLIDIQVFSTIIDCDSTISRTTISTNAIDPTFTYDGAETITETTANVDITTPGIYSVTVTDDNGCSASQFFIVEGSADVPVYMTEDISTACDDSNPMLPLVIMSPVDSVLWSGPNGFLSDEENPIAIDTGIYTITVYGSDGCTVSSDITYTQFDVPNIINIIGDTITCVQDSAMLCVDDFYTSVEWNFNAAVISNDSCIMVAEPGSYSVNIIDMNGCTGSGTYDVTTIDLSGIIINNLPDSVSITCQDTIVQLSPSIQGDTTGLLFNWFNSDTLVNNEDQLNVSSAGLYVFELTDPSSGCNVSDSSFVSLIESTLDADEIFILSDTIQCDADSTLVVISGIDLEDIELYINQELISDPLNIMLAEGEYEFTFIDSLGCEITKIETIVAVDIFTLDLGPDITVTTGLPTDIQVSLSIPLSEVASFEWSDADIVDCIICLDLGVVATEDQILSLTVTDNNGCTQTDSLAISVLDDNGSSDIYAPNIFSPGINGENNNWQLYLVDGNTELLEMRIYDRWGNLVIFRSNSGQLDEFIWDGTFGGINAEQGVYVYIVKYLDNNDNERLIHGQITLVR